MFRVIGFVGLGVTLLGLGLALETPRFPVHAVLVPVLTVAATWWVGGSADAGAPAHARALAGASLTFAGPGCCTGMSRAFLLAVLGAGLELAGCAERKPVPRPELPALPRSSIAAILQHRADLGLTDEQVQKLQARDDQLEAANAGLHEPGTPRRRPDGEPGGMRRGGGMHHGGGGARRESHIESVQQQRDANDTAAFTEVEPVLTDAQRPRAEAVASQYREQLYRQREALKQWRESQGGGGASWEPRTQDAPSRP